MDRNVDCSKYYGWITFDYYIEFDPYCKRHVFMETNQYHGETYKYEMKIDTLAYTWTFKDTLNNNILIDTAAKQIKLENASVNYLDLNDNNVKLLANTSILITVDPSKIKLTNDKIVITTPKLEIIADNVEETIGVEHLITGLTRHKGDVYIEGGRLFIDGMDIYNVLGSFSGMSSQLSASQGLIDAMKAQIADLEARVTELEDAV